MDWGKETSGTVVYPSATYKVRLDSYERKEASTGTPQIKWKAEIVEPAEHQGRYIVDFTALTEKSLWKVANCIQGFGVNTMNMGITDTNSSGFEEVLKACVGRTAFWRNEEGVSNQGNPRNNIVGYTADGLQEELVLDGSDESVPDFAKDEAPPTLGKEVKENDIAWDD